MQSKIPYSKPSITDLEVDYATNAARNGWGEKCYEYINKFEIEFAKHIGTKYAISTSSCTGALHMGLHAMGIGPGDEVIVADTNWIATIAPIIHLGAKPIFVDILSDSWCINPDLVEGFINKKTKAIIAVHLYGNLCNMNKLIEIGNKYSIPIIEDSAEALGSKYLNKKAGSIGLFGAFSFHGTKTMTTGEGGMFVTNNEEIYQKVLQLSNHGRSKSNNKQFWVDKIGFKYKMSNIQAAIGCAQLARIDELIERKREIFYTYKKYLLDIKNISINLESKGNINGFWMPTIVFDENSSISSELITKVFTANNIDARSFFWPLSSLPMFKDQLKNMNSYSICNRAINLPSFHDIKEEEINRVINCIKEIINL